MYKISIIIPCYNEEKSISKLVEKCSLAAKNRTDVQFVFIDNGSKDKTGEALRDEISFHEFGNAKVLTVPVNKGYGYGIKFGLLNSQTKILAWTHADLQTDPLDVVKAYDLYKNNLELKNVIVKGIRNSRPAFDVFFTKVMSYFCSFVLHVKLFDVNAQPKIFNNKLLRILDSAPDDFLFDLYFLYTSQVLKFDILTFSVDFGSRKYGRAKGADSLIGKFRISYKTILYTFKLKKIKLITHD